QQERSDGRKSKSRGDEPGLRATTCLVASRGRSEKDIITLLQTVSAELSAFLTVGHVQQRSCSETQH
ncbi:hypothetical protein BaRGS_00034769, partial [Batillaria attramentaria]